MALSKYSTQDDGLQLLYARWRFVTIQRCLIGQEYWLKYVSNDSKFQLTKIVVFECFFIVLASHLYGVRLESELGTLICPQDSISIQNPLEFTIYYANITYYF